jgi:hypothetical protein
MNWSKFNLIMAIMFLTISILYLIDGLSFQDVAVIALAFINFCSRMTIRQLETD